MGPFTWTLGFPITPMLTLFSTNPTGVVFGNGFNRLDGPYTSFVIGDYTGQTRPPEHF